VVAVMPAVHRDDRTPFFPPRRKPSDSPHQVNMENKELPLSSENILKKDVLQIKHILHQYLVHRIVSSFITCSLIALPTGTR
jgi:hypothetical protein